MHVEEGTMEGSDSEEASSSDSDPEDDEYSIFGDLSDETGSDASDASDVDVLEAEVVEALQHLQDAHHRKDKPEMTPYQQHILTYYVLCQKAQFSRNTLENELLPQVNRTFVLLEPNSKEKRFTNLKQLNMFFLDKLPKPPLIRHFTHGHTAETQLKVFFKDLYDSIAMLLVNFEVTKNWQRCYSPSPAPEFASHPVHSPRWKQSEKIFGTNNLIGLLFFIDGFQPKPWSQVASCNGISFCLANAPYSQQARESARVVLTVADKLVPTQDLVRHIIVEQIQELRRLQKPFNIAISDNGGLESRVMTPFLFCFVGDGPGLRDAARFAGHLAPDACNPHLASIGDRELLQPLTRPLKSAPLWTPEMVWERLLSWRQRAFGNPVKRPANSAISTAMMNERKHLQAILIHLDLHPDVRLLNTPGYWLTFFLDHKPPPPYDNNLPPLPREPDGRPKLPLPLPQPPDEAAAPVAPPLPPEHEYTVLSAWNEWKRLKADPEATDGDFWLLVRPFIQLGLWASSKQSQIEDFKNMPAPVALELEECQVVEYPLLFPPDILHVYDIGMVPRLVSYIELSCSHTFLETVNSHFHRAKNAPVHSSERNVNQRYGDRFIPQNRFNAPVYASAAGRREKKALKKRADWQRQFIGEMLPVALTHFPHLLDHASIKIDELLELLNSYNEMSRKVCEGSDIEAMSQSIYDFKWRYLRLLASKQAYSEVKDDLQYPKWEAMDSFPASVSYLGGAKFFSTQRFESIHRVLRYLARNSNNQDLARDMTLKSSIINILPSGPIKCRPGLSNQWKGVVAKNVAARASLPPVIAATAGAAAIYKLHMHSHIANVCSIEGRKLCAWNSAKGDNRFRTLFRLPGVAEHLCLHSLYSYALGKGSTSTKFYWLVYYRMEQVEQRLEVIDGKLLSHPFNSANPIAAIGERYMLVNPASVVARVSEIKRAGPMFTVPLGYLPNLDKETT